MADFKMPEINYVVIAGNLTHDPVFRKTQNGGSLVNFTIALNKRYRDGNNKRREEVYYINIFALNRLAESCSQKLRRGSGVILEGELQSKSRRTGDKNTTANIEVKARRVQFLNKYASAKDDAKRGGDENIKGEDTESPISFEDDQYNQFISSEESDLKRRDASDL